MDKVVIISLIVLNICLAAEVKLEVVQSHANHTSEHTQINGMTVIDNQELETSCECVNTTPEAKVNEELCDPTKIKLHQDSPGKGSDGATFEEVRFMVGPLDQLVFVDPTSYHFSCLDGRIKNPVLGTPGGDAGEFILALSIYEQLTPSRLLTQETVDSIFTSYLMFMKQHKFYMCTDDDAIDHIEKELGIILSLDSLKNPIPQVQMDLMRVLLKPENTGCFHIKSMLKNPDNYNIRVEIIEMFLKSYYKTYWDKSNPLIEKFILDGLVGQKNERAFLEIRSNEACQKKRMAPLISPRKRVTIYQQEISPKQQEFQDNPPEEFVSVFVNHIDAVSSKRREIAKFFSEHVNHNGEHIDVDQMQHRLNKHGLSYLELTGARIARYLPFYTLNLV